MFSRRKMLAAAVAAATAVVPCSLRKPRKRKCVWILSPLYATGHYETVSIETVSMRESPMEQYHPPKKIIAVPGVEKIDSAWDRKFGHVNNEANTLSIRVACNETAAEAFNKANGYAWQITMVEV